MSPGHKPSGPGEGDFFMVRGAFPTVCSSVVSGVGRCLESSAVTGILGWA